jgi:predicted ATPase
MQFTSWMNKDDWSKQICEMHQIEPKLNITNILHESFVSLGKDIEKLEFSAFASKQTLRTNIAMQILSVCFEMTEDLAATCFSYAKAIKAGNKNVPEYLRDFGAQKKKPEEEGNATLFYKTASENICFTAEMVGLDPINDVSNVFVYQNFFRNVRDFRKKYDDWYQGYKHGQRTEAMYVWALTAEPNAQNVSFLMYRIPQTLQEKDSKIFVEADFIDTIKDEPNFVALVGDIVKAWQGVKQVQFAKVFPAPPPAQASQATPAVV